MFFDAISAVQLSVSSFKSIVYSIHLHYNRLEFFAGVGGPPSRAADCFYVFQTIRNSRLTCFLAWTDATEDFIFRTVYM